MYSDLYDFADVVQVTTTTACSCLKLHIVLSLLPAVDSQLLGLSAQWTLWCFLLCPSELSDRPKFTM